MSGVYVRHMNLPTFNGEEAIRAEIRLVGKQNPQPCLGIMTNASSCCEEWTYYPLQDVPDHGNLIDRDKFMGTMLPNNRVYQDDERISYPPTAWQILDSISKAQTVIPADKEA